MFLCFKDFVFIFGVERVLIVLFNLFLVWELVEFFSKSVNWIGCDIRSLLSFKRWGYN